MISDQRLLPADPGVRAIAQRLHRHTRDLPIVSPHGHCDPRALATNAPWGDPARELVTKDHYLLRMLYSQGVSLETLGVRPRDGSASETDGREVWRRLAESYALFHGTPSKLWLDYTLAKVFGIDVPLTAGTADRVYDELVGSLAKPGFLPRALFERFDVEVLATTDAALDSLDSHRQLRASGWVGRVIPTFRPDDVVDPDQPDFVANVDRLAELTGHDTSRWPGYLAALRERRAHFISLGTTASDHGHPTASTADLTTHEAERLFGRVRCGAAEPGDAELFRGLLLTELAAMSLDDGLVMQLHVGSWRNHNPTLFDRFGADRGADIPRAIDFVGGLKPLLDRFGNDPALTIVIYTLDESAYSRELAPLAGHYPALRLGPPWWFNDSPEGIRRFRSLVTETAGFANTVGFNDDARSLLMIPARHDVARRVDAGFLAGLVAEHRLDETEAADIAVDLAYGLARRSFRLVT